MVKMNSVLLIQLAGGNLFLFLGKLYIMMLKQLGGCFGLIGKKQLPLYKEQNIVFGRNVRHRENVD